MSARQSHRVNSESRPDRSMGDQPKASARRGWMRRLLHRAATVGMARDRHYGMESLEKRTLLTTITSIGTSGYSLFYTGQDQVGIITYNDVDFEAIGAIVDPTSGNIISLGNVVPAAATEPMFGADIYKIYVTESNADSYITLSTISAYPTATAPTIRPTPYGGAVTLGNLFNAQTGNAYTAAAGPGGVLIGSLETAPVTQAGQPIDGIQITAPIGLQPVPADGILTPGIEVIPTNPDTGAQNNFGEFFVGGVVTGDVSFGGNVNEFYAGSVLTGETTGGSFEAGTAARPLPDNFHVAGDLREFLVGGSVGTDGTLNKAGDLSSLNYVTDFDLSVGGKLGEAHVGGSFAGTIEAGNSPYISGQTAYPAGTTNPIAGLTSNQTEVESDPAQDPDWTFIGNISPQVGNTTSFSNNPYDPVTGETVPPALNSALFSNNTLGSAQVLGSIPEISTTTGLPDRDVDGNIIYQASVDGTVDSTPTNPDNDTYAVAMLAGSTFQAQLSLTDFAKGTSTANALADIAQLEVFDPDGRLIASDAASPGTLIQVTADRPGLYRLRIEPFNRFGDQTFTLFDYELTVTNVGNMGIGGIHIGGNYDDLGIDQGIISGNGDIGVIELDGAYVSLTDGPARTSTTAPEYAPSSILVASGNLRALTAASLGYFTVFTAPTSATGGVSGFSSGPYLSVPNGSVGLIQATGTALTDVLDIRGQYDPNYLGLSLTTPVYKTDDLYASAIGGDIQVIDAAGLLYAEIATNRGIGTIRAAAMNSIEPSHIEVNADNTGDDGIIDLIDVSGQFGHLGGGPEFVTNTGGNIRYLNLNTSAGIFLPVAFGGLEDFPVNYPIGATDSFTDDSGAVFTITAAGPVTTIPVITTNSSGGTVTTNVSEGTAVTVWSYPVLDHAGLVPISISAEDSAASNGSAGSLIVSGSGINGADSEVDIAQINITGEGRPITAANTQQSDGVISTGTDIYGNVGIIQGVPTNGSSGATTEALTDPTDEFLLINGPAKVNVLSVTATVLAGFTTNSPVEIENTTQGEMVNITAPFGIGTISVGGNLGFATPEATAAAVMPRAVITDGNTFPFVQQHTGVVIGTGFVVSGVSAGATGDVVSIDVGGAAGNIEAGDTIGSLIVNYGQSSGVKGAVPIAGQIDGIVGPVLGARLLYVDVGQGLTPSGSGLVGLSGLYATGKIGAVNNAGNPNGDIRGDIIAAEDLVDGELAAQFDGIDSVTLVNASIIGSDIETLSDNAGAPGFVESSPISPLPSIPTDNGTNFALGNTSAVYDIGPISVSGDGGIIGSQISTGSIAAISVANGGFGILNDYIVGQAEGQIGTIIASGYGIRDTTVRGAGYLGPVIANGSGALIPVTNYPIDVRPSDIANTLDPFFGIVPSKLIDLNAVLGTSALAPNIPGRTDTGVIEDDIFNGLNNFVGLTAQKARTIQPVVSTNELPTPSVLNIPTIGTVFSNSITFGGVVGSVHIYQETDGLQITCGQLNALSLSSSVNRVGLSVAGRIAALVVHGNLGAFVTDPETDISQPDSYINAEGPNGTIGMIRVMGDLNANVYATGQIGSVTVTGDVEGGIIAYAKTTGLALTSLHVFGGIRDGSLELYGNVGSIIVNGTFGTSAGALSISGSCNLISVGANHRVPDTTLGLNLFVAGTLKSLIVHGSITGSVHTGIDLTHLTVTNNGGTVNAITGNIAVDGRLGTANIIGGSVTSNITVTGNVGSFTLTGGNLNAGASFNSSVGSIGQFRTLGGAGGGGNVFGTIYALNSNYGSFNISGNVGDGVNPATIVANSANTIRIGGNVNDHTSIALTQSLNLLNVIGSVEGGATISAHPLKRQKIAGINDGTIVSV